jgi:hypothetical protein
MYLEDVAKNKTKVHDAILNPIIPTKETSAHRLLADEQVHPFCLLPTSSAYIFIFHPWWASMLTRTRLIYTKGVLP